MKPKRTAQNDELENKWTNRKCALTGAGKCGALLYTLNMCTMFCSHLCCAMKLLCCSLYEATANIHENIYKKKQQKQTKPTKSQAPGETAHRNRQNRQQYTKCNLMHQFTCSWKITNRKTTLASILTLQIACIFFSRAVVCDGYRKDMD